MGAAAPGSARGLGSEGTGGLRTWTADPGRAQEALRGSGRLGAILNDFGLPESWKWQGQRWPGTATGSRGPAVLRGVSGAGGPRGRRGGVTGTERALGPAPRASPPNTPHLRGQLPPPPSRSAVHLASGSRGGRALPALGGAGGGRPAGGRLRAQPGREPGSEPERERPPRRPQPPRSRWPAAAPPHRRKALPRTPAVAARRFRPETNGPAEAKAPPPGRRPRPRESRPLGLSGADAVEGARRARAFEPAGLRVLASRVCKMGAGARCRDVASAAVRPEAPLGGRALGRVGAWLRRPEHALPARVLSPAPRSALSEPSDLRTCARSLSSRSLPSTGVPGSPEARTEPGGRSPGGGECLRALPVRSPHPEMRFRTG